MNTIIHILKRNFSRFYFNSIMNEQEQTVYIRGILLLALAIGGNFLAETLPCKTHTFFRTNMIAKQVLVIFLIFFTINFTNPIGENPLQHMLQTLLLWVGYIIITRLDLAYMIPSFVLLGIMYFIQTYIDYHKKNQQNDTVLTYFFRIQQSIKYLLIIIIILGILDTFQNNGAQKIV